MQTIMINATDRDMLRYRQMAEYDWNTLVRSSERQLRVAEQKMKEAEQRIKEAEQRIKEAEQRIEEAEQRARDAEQTAQAAQDKTEVARILKSRGVNPDTITLSTGMTLEEIDTL